MNIWVVKCREVPQNGSDGWHWDRYFEGDDDDPRAGFSFGGSDWIRSNWSRMYIRDEVQRGDLVVCYQYEGRLICGLTKMTSDGQEQEPGTGEFNFFWLERVCNAFRLSPEITVPLLRKHGSNPACFKAGTQGTIFPISQSEFRQMVRAISDASPEQSRALARWLQKAG